MNDEDLITPDLDGIPENDEAEMPDQDAPHDVSHWDMETAVNHDG